MLGWIELRNATNELERRRIMSQPIAQNTSNSVDLLRRQQPLHVEEGVLDAVFEVFLESDFSRAKLLERRAWMSAFGGKVWCASFG